MRPSVCVLRLSGFIRRHLYLASNLPPPFPYCCFNRLWGHSCLGSRLSSETISYRRRCSPLYGCKPGEVKVSESFFTFVNKRMRPYTAQFIDKGIMHWCVRLVRNINEYKLDDLSDTSRSTRGFIIGIPRAVQLPDLSSARVRQPA